MGRFRQGITDDLDLGVDALGVQHADKGTMAFKVAARYALAPHLRLEGGAGAADDSDGKSLSYDFAVVTGTRREATPWNYYAALRTTGAFSFPGNVCCGGGSTGTTAPPNSFLLLGTVGAEAKVSEVFSFIFEGGAGPLWVQGRGDVGAAFYFGTGFLAKIGVPERP